MKIVTAADFGRLIRQRRQFLGLTQRALALAVNVGERFIVDLEAGKETAQLGRALRVAQALEIELSDNGKSQAPQHRPSALKRSSRFESE